MSAEARRGPLAEVLRDLCFDRADGILAVQLRGSRLQVYLDRGEVFYAKSDAPEQRLDQVLVRWGLVAPDVVAGLVQRAGRDVRGALVREGVFPSVAAFDQFMAGVLRERVLEAFAEEAPPAEFSAEDVRSLHQIPFGTSTPNLVLEGVRRMSGAEKRLEPLVREDAVLSLNPRPPVPLESLAMAPAEGWVLSQLDGRAPLSAILGVSPAGEPQTLRILYGLLLLDVVRHPAFAGYRFQLEELARRAQASESRDAADRERIEAEYRRLRGGDLFDVVPDARGMRPDELRKAPRAYQDSWKAELFSDRVARQMRDQLLLIGGRAGEALLALMDAERKRGAESGGGETVGDVFKWTRMELSRSQAQEQADASEHLAAEWLRRARDSFARRDFHAAVEHARESVRCRESAQAQALLAESLAQNPKWARRAEEAYVRAMELDAFNPSLPLALGRIYARHGLKERARELFERSLKVQPDFEEAKLALKELKRS